MFGIYNISVCFMRLFCYMVLLAGPSMMNGGLSLEVFKKWAPNANNMIVFPGYCLPGTVGNEVLALSKRVRVPGGVGGVPDQFVNVD